jgi:hypothetical protein
VYRLKGDDGAELRMNDGIWESALELACLYGWKPAGTEAPRTAAWHGRRTAQGPATWNGRDYFSSESQHVADRDSRALADALRRALQQVETTPRVDAAVAGGGSPLPSRASARADGLSLSKRKSMSRLAEFAARRGFTIDAAV